MKKSLNIKNYILTNLLDGEGASQTWLAEKQEKKYVLKMKAINPNTQKLMERSIKLYK